MNNFELDRRAKELAASNSGYNLARRFLMLEDQLAEARRESEKPQQAQRERSPSDYAIEHAGYMATAAEALISGLNKNSVDGEDYFSIDDDILDSIRTLNNRVYEFQKRRDRALSVPPATAAWAEVYEALGRTDEPSFPAPAAVPEVTETAKRRAGLFLDSLHSDGCNEVKTLRNLLAAAPAPEGPQ